MTDTLDLDLLDPATPTTALGWKERHRLRAAQAALREPRTERWADMLADRIDKVCATARSRELRRAGVIRPIVRRRTLGALEREAARLRQLQDTSTGSGGLEPVLDETCEHVERLLALLETTECRPANREPYLALWRDLGGSG